MPEADLRFRPGCMADVASFRRGMQLFWDPRGRSSRTELFLLFLIPSIAYPLILAAISFAIEIPAPELARFLLTFAIAIPLPAAVARRFHDQGRTGWLAVPFVGLTLIHLWNAWLNVTRSYPESDLWFNQEGARYLYLMACAAFLVALMLPPKDRDNRYGSNPRPAEKQI